MVHEHPRIGSDGESEEGSGTSEDPNVSPGSGDSAASQNNDVTGQVQLILLDDFSCLIRRYISLIFPSGPVGVYRNMFFSGFSSLYFGGFAWLEEFSYLIRSHFSQIFPSGPADRGYRKIGGFFLAGQFFFANFSCLYFGGFVLADFSQCGPGCYILADFFPTMANWRWWGWPGLTIK